MNICFIIGKIVGYDKIADYCYKNLKKNDTVIIEGKIGNLKNSMVIMIINCIKL